jgi:hypothetical protein
MFCPVCGTKNRIDANWCLNCKFPLARFQWAQTIQAAKPQISQKSSSLKPGFVQHTQSGGNMSSSLQSQSSTHSRFVQPQSSELLPASQPLPLENILAIINGRIIKVESSWDEDYIEIVEREVETHLAILENIISNYRITTKLAEIYQFQSRLGTLLRKANQAKKYAVQRRNQLRSDIGTLDSYTKYLKEIMPYGDIPTLELAFQHCNFLLNKLVREASSSTTSIPDKYFSMIDESHYRILSIRGDIERRHKHEEASKRPSWGKVMRHIGAAATLVTTLVGLGAVLSGRKVA